MLQQACMYAFASAAPPSLPHCTTRSSRTNRCQTYVHLVPATMQPRKVSSGQTARGALAVFCIWLPLARLPSPAEQDPAQLVIATNICRRLGWYQRYDNNNWRPVAPRLLSTGDPEPQDRPQTKLPLFSHKVALRRQQRARKVEQMREAWFAQLHRYAAWLGTWLS